MTGDCDIVLPCRDEAAALADLLPRVADVRRIIVVDNGSRDETAQTARRFGARVVSESQPGYGAAVHAGVCASRAEFVAVMDGDGSFDPASLAPLLDAVRSGSVDLALGRRRPVRSGVWPWHARVGNVLVLALLRRRTGLALRDLGPMRVCRRETLLALDVRDRRFGYPLELVHKAARSGLRVAEFDVPYLPRTAGTRSKVSGSVRGTLHTAHDFRRVLS